MKHAYTLSQDCFAISQFTLMVKHSLTHQVIMIRVPLQPHKILATVIKIYEKADITGLSDPVGKLN